jgi:TP901 family phage tail tape measure protein
MAKKVVETKFTAVDGMSKVLSGMGKRGEAMGRNIGRAMDRASKRADNFKSVVSGILTAKVIAGGVNALRIGIRGLTDEFLDFDDAITAASAKFGVFDRESKVFKELTDSARAVGAATEFTAAQAGEGLRFLAKAGWEANAAMKALHPLVNLATASEMDFARASDIATDVMGAFRLKSEDATENMKQLVRVSDVLSKAVNMSNVDMENLFETIKFAGPIANTAGVSLEKFSAMAAFIGGAGIKGSLGGTALRTMFVNLAAPTNKAIKQFRKLGIELQTSTGDLRDPIEVLKELSEGFKGMGNAQQTAALKLIFGKRAVSGAAVSVDGATKALGEFEKALINSTDNSKKLADFMRTSLKKRLDRLKSAAVEVGLKFIDHFGKRIPGAIDKLVKAVESINVKAVIDDIKRLGRTIVNVVDFLKRWSPIIKGLAVTWH